TFQYPLVLLLAVVPLVWMLLEFRRGSRKISTALKALSFSAIFVALAQPVVTTSQNKMAVAVLVDTSASISTTTWRALTNWRRRSRKIEDVTGFACCRSRVAHEICPHQDRV